MTLKKTLTSSGKEKYSINILHKINHRRLQSAEQKRTGVCKKTAPVALPLKAQNFISISYLAWEQIVDGECSFTFLLDPGRREFSFQEFDLVQVPHNLHREDLKGVQEECGHGGHWLLLCSPDTAPTPSWIFLLLLIKWIVCRITAWGLWNNKQIIHFLFLISGVWPCLWDFMLDATRKF